MPPLGVPVEQLRPDPAYVQLILGAVYDIRICSKIFDGWATQLDKCAVEPRFFCHVPSDNRFNRVPSSSQHKPEERELALRHHLDLLREDVSWCSRETDEILLCHAQFAYVTAQRIDNASKSWLKGLKYGSDTTRLANDISQASRSLSKHVTQMQGNLRSFVSTLEKMEVGKKTSAARRVLG